MTGISAISRSAQSQLPNARSGGRADITSREKTPLPHIWWRHSRSVQQLMQFGIDSLHTGSRGGAQVCLCVVRRTGMGGTIPFLLVRLSWSTETKWSRAVRSAVLWLHRQRKQGDGRKQQPNGETAEHRTGAMPQLMPSMLLVVSQCY